MFIIDFKILDILTYIKMYKNFYIKMFTNICIQRLIKHDLCMFI